VKAFIGIRAPYRALALVWAALAVILSPLAAAAQQPPPNILVIMGDDIGCWNISAYNRGQMGYRTPNIDRIANEGAILTDYYGQQSCTAGRAAFITGPEPDANRPSDATAKPAAIAERLGGFLRDREIYPDA
jgi:arylsulfatase A-like enzyme